MVSLQSPGRWSAVVPSFFMSMTARRRLARAANLMPGNQRRLINTTMPLEPANKLQIMEEYALSSGDTGSTDVQIALMHARIKQITEHLKTNRKDFHSRAGLLRLVGKRRRLEAYMRDVDIVRYRQLIGRLGIREVRPR